MEFYYKIEDERDRIQESIKKFGHTSDHNLDWWSCSVISFDGVPVFVQWPDGSGILAHKYPDKWRIWSDPLSEESDMAQRIEEFALKIFTEFKPKEIWCDDVADKIYPDLKKIGKIVLGGIYYSLLWPVLDMSKYEPVLPGGEFKDMRTARSKFYREHRVEVLKTDQLPKTDLLKIVDSWLIEVVKKQKEDVYDLKYRKIIEKDFAGFTTARVLMVDGKPTGINAGYEVCNRPNRFAGVVGIHDYSYKDLGTILWLEDLDWIKRAGYKEIDMQGSEDDGGLRLKMKFGSQIERKTDTFSILL